jgi:hypothetical protein
MKMWIARATGNVLTLHQFKPEKLRMDEESDDYFWASDIETISFLNRSLFPEVTFENSPQEVELKLIEK